jgi:prevent-host-death family protein
VKTVGIFEAKAQFSRLCVEVERSGRPILVSKRGKPIAWIAPVREEVVPERRGILEDWLAWEQGHPGGVREPDFPDVTRDRHSKAATPFEDDT